MTDEAFHHKFGKIWAQATLPKLEESERNLVEDWALDCFNRLLFNIADEGIAYLKTVNTAKHKVVKKLNA